MRIWHVLALVFLTAMGLSVSSSTYGRIALILFLVGLAEVFVGATALMKLFKSVGSFGQAKTIGAHLEAALATAVIAVVGGVSMTALLWIGGIILQFVTPQ